MDISEQNHIQDGKIFLKTTLNGKEVGVNMRVSSLPVIHGENIVMRLLLTESEYLSINSL
jgi:type II secretory ATPase GspE/PulE/Tfp pilus assembly ATPase PilB-like protein